MFENENHDRSIKSDATARQPWVKPEIASFAPAKAAEGISYRPNDGISNLTV